MVPSVVEIFHDKACKIYIIMSQVLSKATPNTTLLPTEALVYKALQYFFTDDEFCGMFKHILHKWAPRIGGKSEHL